MSNKRLLELDALRGIAAISVMLYHYLTRYDELFNKSGQVSIDLSYGKYGVELFFLISGFVIFMSIKDSTTIRKFAYKRAVRLYPAYFIAVLLTFIIVTSFGLPGRESTLTDVLVNFTMLQGFIPGVNHVDGVYWTLTVEIIFYFIIAFLIVFHLTRRISLICIIWIITALSLEVTSNYFEISILSIAKTLLITKYCHLFIIGIMFYKIKHKPHFRYYTIIMACLLYDIILKDYVSNVFIFLLILLFICLINGYLRFLNNRSLIYLGSISYPLYLVHQNIGYVILNMFNNLGIENHIVFLVPVIISIAIASLITFYIEKPLQRLKQTKFKEDTKINKNKAIL
jgi:peptidoglycan/LPS O-acetylase OafA/YrhL